MEQEIKKEEIVVEPEVKKEDFFPEKIIVAPHTKKSRLVTEKDLDKIVEDAKILYKICHNQVGLYTGAYAMHHSQINDKDPLNFYVTWSGDIVLNAKIVKHSNYTKDSKEACMSFADRPEKIVQRWQKIEIEFITVMVDSEDKEKFKLSDLIVVPLSGHEALIAQHECDHGNGLFIYEINEKEDVK